MKEKQNRIDIAMMYDQLIYYKTAIQYYNLLHSCKEFLNEPT